MRFILFVAVFLIHQLPCVAGNKCLRALIVADTHTISTAVSAEIDTSLMKKCMHVISKEIGYRLRLKVLQLDDCTRHNIKKWCLSLPDRSGDIIFIYFTGHGSQDGIEGPWPVLRIPKGTYLRSAEILYFLRQHKHRLAVAVINACNVQPSVTDTHEILTHGHQNIFHNASLPGFKSLFLGTRGIVFISASSPGGVSYSFDCSESVIVDGLFKTFDSLCPNPDVTWQSILSSAHDYCLHTTEAFPDGPQKLNYLIE